MARIHSSGEPNPNRMKLLVCFYKADGSAAGDCRDRLGSQDGIGTSWKDWAFFATAPANAATATVGLRTYADTGDGWAYWDDAGFYAYRPPA